MSGSCGKWLSLREFARAKGVDEARAKELLAGEGLLSKSMHGEEYVWVEDPALLEKAGVETGEESESQPDSEEPESGSPSPGEEKEAAERGGESEREPRGEALPARFSGVQELAHQTERAISLVERSIAAFMMMHEEVVREKERMIELVREGTGKKDERIKELEAEVEKLRKALKEKEQDLADLKMLVEILEGRMEREVRSEQRGMEKASVGDLMEDQLRYIMEDQMIQKLMKE